MGKKKMCCNCKFSSSQFKIGNMTYIHCNHPRFTEEKMISGEQHPYDPIMQFWEKCEDFEHKKPSEK